MRLLRAGASILCRGISQIYFQSNIRCGLLVLATFATADWRMAVLVLLGAASSTAAAVVLRLGWDEIVAGFHGFCRALMGASSFAALGAGWAGVTATAAGGAACTPVAVGVAHVFSGRRLKQFKLPVMTAPFCIVAGLTYRLAAPPHLSGSRHSNSRLCVALHSRHLAGPGGGGMRPGFPAAVISGTAAAGSTAAVIAPAVPGGDAAATSVLLPHPR